MKISLRHYLAGAFVIAAIIPIIGFGMWMHDNATKRAFESVAEKHLLVAKNAKLAMRRYADDLKAVFTLFVETEGRADAPMALATLAQTMDIRYFAIVRNDRVATVIPGVDESFDGLPPNTFTRLRLGPVKTGIMFQDVARDAQGRPAIYMTQALGEGRFAVANIGTSFLLELQQDVEFGSRGHAAIVDGAGTLIAHPRPEWILKNIASLAPVEEMMAGRTGTMQFFSPAVKKEMVVGYTSLPETGWGVMVPQPTSEILADSNQITRMAVAFIVLGIVVASLLAWALSDLFTGPVTKLIDGVLDYVEGKPGARGIPVNRYTPSEFRQLNSGFQLMAELARSGNGRVAAGAMANYFVGNQVPAGAAPLWPNVAANGSAAMNDWMSKSYTVLYVDEVAGGHDLVETLLRQILPNSEMISAFTGAESLELARTIAPDLIILDIDLRDLNGYAILQFYQEFEETASVPVIALRRELDPLSTQQALESGFSGAIKKPVVATELFGAVERVLNRMN